VIGLRKRPLFALAALVGFVFSGASEARGLEPCPHHDSLPISLDAGHTDHGATRAGDATEAAAESAHASHDVAATDHSEHTGTADDAPAEHESDHGPCNCIGQCDAGSSATVLSPVTITLHGDSPTPVASPPAADGVFSRSGDSLWLFHQPTAPPFSV
jgi:hypothetical protein